jgi:signal transduction histidine kinase
LTHDLEATVSSAGIPAEAVSDAFLDAVVPEGLAPEELQRAREDAEAFLRILLRHIGGDPEALAEIEARVHGVAGELVHAGADPGVLLDRFDHGRHVLLCAVTEQAVTTGASEVIGTDDRLRSAQRAARQGVSRALADFEAELDSAVAEVTRAIESRIPPDEVMQTAAATLCRLVQSDRARLWLDIGGGRLELVASAGSTAPMGFFVSSERGVLADILREGLVVTQCPVDARAWERAVPNLPIPASALFIPLVAAGRSFGMLYALRNDPVPFTATQVRIGARFVERVEPALAWAMQLRSLRRWADASQDFLRFITHELRRPLTVLRGYLDMLESVSSAEASVLRERMERAADQLADQLTGITDTVTLEDPVRALSLSSISAGELIDAAAAAARDEAEQAGVELIAEAVDPEIVLQCDVDNVLHALANLLSNAFRHTAGRRRVWLTGLPDGSRFVRLAVRDEGPGVSAGDQAKLFLKYFRSDETRRSGALGSGLGLYFVRLVAERHGGRVAVENRPEGGAQFTLELPLEPGLVAWSI